jgi:hypothetical protein
VATPTSTAATTPPVTPRASGPTIPGPPPGAPAGPIATAPGPDATNADQPAPDGTGPDPAATQPATTDSPTTSEPDSGHVDLSPAPPDIDQFLPRAGGKPPSAATSPLERQRRRTGALALSAVLATTLLGAGLGLRERVVLRRHGGPPTP